MNHARPSIAAAIAVLLAANIVGPPLVEPYAAIANTSPGVHENSWILRPLDLVASCELVADGASLETKC